MTNTITYTDWLADGAARFGTSDLRAWRFECPNCGGVASGADLVHQGQAPGVAAVECLTRYTVNSPEADAECRWSASGFLRTLGKGVHVERNGEVAELFPFAVSTEH